MATTHNAARQQIETYHNGSVTADIVQQGTGNAARDINHVGRDVNNITHIVNNRTSKPSPSSTVPFRRDADFITCDSLNKIQQICTKPAGCAALIGLGGVGKSQIAIEYTYRLRDTSPTTWAFWVHAGTQTRFEEGYRRIAEATKMDGWDNPKLDVLRLVRSWLCDESNGRWTMVVDNADDADVFFSPLQASHATSVARPHQAAELLSDFLPQSPNGSILVTSRSQDVAYRLTGSRASIFEVGPMKEGEALVLLQKKLPDTDANVDMEKVKELLQALDYMPLAITQAAAYIAQRSPRMTVARYLDEVRTSDCNRARLLERDVGDSRRDGRASNSIIMTWQVSFEHIRRKMPAAARLLSLMSLFDRQGIPESLLRDRYGLDEEQERVDFDDDIHTLTSYSLVAISGVNGSEFEMHRLVQYSTKKWLELSGELEEWKARYVALIDGSYPVGEYENWKVCRALFPHAQAVVDCRPEEANALKAWASVLFKAAWYASEMGRYALAKEMDHSAFEVRERVLGPEHPDTLNSMSNLAVVLDSQGKYKEAETLHRQTLAQCEEVLGPEHPSTLTSMNNLARVLHAQGKCEEAEVMHRQTLARRKEVLGPEHPSTLMSMNNLARVLHTQGKCEEAETLHRQTLARREEVLGPEHPSTLMSMNNLAGVLYKQGKYKEAEVMHRQTLERQEEVLGPEHLDTLISMNNLALVLDSQGKYKEAEAMHRQTLARRKEVLGPEHPSTLTSMNNLAGVLHAQGKCEEVEGIQRQGLAICEKVLGPMHPDTLISVRNLAWLLACWHRVEESLLLYQRASAGYNAVLGKDHPTTLQCHQDYADLRALQEQQQLTHSPSMLHSGARKNTKKTSKLSRALAKIGITDFKP